MCHEIQEREWLDYVSGTLDARAAARVSSHLEACGECARLLVELHRWHDRLHAEGARLRKALELPAAEMDAFVERAVERICAEAGRPLRAGRRRSTAESMFVLRSLIEPIFGSGTAKVTMDLAVRRCTADPRGELEGGQWRLFVRNLSEALASICGTAAGRVVHSAGNSLAVEEG